MNREHVHKALAWWQLRKRSEQLLLGATLVVALVMGLQKLVMVPLKAYQAGLTKQLDAQHADLRQVREKLASVGPEQIKQLQAQTRARLLAVRAELTHAQEAMAELRAGLVPAGNMADVLGGLLRTHRGVQLAEVMNLPVVALRPQAEVAGKSVEPNAKSQSKTKDADAAAVTESAGPILYKHPLRIILRGRYLEIAKYLAAVEDLPWRVYFDGLTLEVEAYPLVEATIELHTLSEDEAWFFTS